MLARPVAAVLSLVLVLLAGCDSNRVKKPPPTETVAIPVKEIIQQLELALHQIDQLEQWEPMRRRAEQASQACKRARTAAALDGERLCPKVSDDVVQACGCTNAGCADRGTSACRDAIASHEARCAFAEKADAAHPACKLSASLKVPRFKQADVALKVQGSQGGEGGLNVILFKAGSSGSITRGQSLNLVLHPKPAIELETADDSPALRNRAEALRRDLIAAISGALEAMASDGVEVEGYGKLRPAVDVDELKVTASIVFKESGNIGFGWEGGGGDLGASAKYEESVSGDNAITLVFKR